MPPKRRLLLAGLVLALESGAGPIAAAPAAPTPSDAERRADLAALKASPKGPFEAIRWFCADGSVLPPTPYACAERGGGIQHGLWSERTRRLRADGFLLANVLADFDPAPLLGAGDSEPLVWVLLERFLVAHDDGWILRGARTYRGALQSEDEESGAKRLLRALAVDPGWTGPERQLLLGEAVRMLPGRADPALAELVRERASALAEKSAAFVPLRNKIHALPDPGDAARVRAFCAAARHAEHRDDCRALAEAIDSLYRPERAAAALARLEKALRGTPAAETIAAVRALLDEGTPVAQRLRASAEALARLRELDASLSRPGPRLASTEARLLLEEAAFAAASEVVAARAGWSRDERLALLEPLAAALYGTGLLSARQHEAVGASLARLRAAEGPSVGVYRRELRYLERVPGWAQRNLAFHFETAEQRLARIEPLASLYVQDRLRGSPLLAFSTLLDDLLLDAMRLAGVGHALFGERVGGGLRALNGGVGRGVLVVADGDALPAALPRDAVVLLPATVAELPPVAGILTRGEGSSLSHVQLLARNLGIPNVVVSEALVPAVQARAGERIVLAASPQGVVQLELDDARFAGLFGRDAPEADLRIRPDLARLDLADVRIRPLHELRAGDSGRSVGPKAANLAELGRVWPERVSRGVVVPFGVFRRLLDRPLEPGGPAVFEWMRERYAAIAALADRPEAQTAETRAFLAQLRDWIIATDPGPELRLALQAGLREVFGAEEPPGVFVRSDTNVEDLPGFTGAGLNLTVPNVVGFDAVVSAISRVWASPFSERAHAWRQALMDRPEYVFPGVLLLESVPSEKSGVLVTADVDSGDREWLSIAVSEGVGGAVEGQAAEELRVAREGGEVRLLAQATAPRKSVLLPAGGVAQVPASGRAELLAPEEIEQLRVLAAEVHQRFPRLLDGSGRAAPADVEFGFVQGRLVLFQIRPFVESRRARRSAWLRGLDAGIEQAARRSVDLAEPPLPPAEEGT